MKARLVILLLISCIPSACKKDTDSAGRAVNKPGAAQTRSEDSEKEIEPTQTVREDSDKQDVEAPSMNGKSQVATVIGANQLTAASASPTPSPSPPPPVIPKADLGWDGKSFLSNSETMLIYPLE